MKKLSLVILAGGKGTRLRSITKNPKPLYKFANIPFIQHQLNYFSKFNFLEIFILTGFKSNLFRLYDKKYINSIPIKIITEKSPLGTGGALYKLKNKIKNDFILINGDTYFPININDFSKNIRKNSIAHIALIKNKNYKSNKSLINLSINKKQILNYKNSSKLMNGGIYFFKKSFFRYLKRGSYSLENKIIPRLIEEKKITGKEYKNFFIDIGTPKNLDFFKKKCKEIFFKKAAFFDRDGVLNYDYGYVYKYKDFKLKNDVIKSLNYLIKKKYHIFIVTNQAGIAKKKFTFRSYLKLNYELKEFFSKKNIYFDGVEFCPHHPKALIEKYKKICNCRKPNNGLIEKIFKNFYSSRNKSFFIGDKKTDFLAAKKSKIKFYYPERKFFQQIKKITRTI